MVAGARLGAQPLRAAAGRCRRGREPVEIRLRGPGRVDGGEHDTAGVCAAARLDRAPLKADHSSGETGTRCLVSPQGAVEDHPAVDRGGARSGRCYLRSPVVNTIGSTT